MSAPTPISALLHSSTMVIAGVIIGLIINDIIIEVLDSFNLFFLSLILLILLTLLWSLLKAISIDDIKSIIAYSTISQISYMFIALLINPFLTLYHIVIHALFKSLLFLLSGSLIHNQYNYQSINKVKIKHTFIKTTLLFTGSVLILSLSKETIIYSSNSIFSSLYITMLLILGTIYTIIYAFNIYLKCFYCASFIKMRIAQSHIYYSFLIPFLIISSILLDIILEYSISLNIGTLFYTIDNGTLITYVIINEHFTIICVIIPIIIISIFIDYLYNWLWFITHSLMNCASLLLLRNYTFYSYAHLYYSFSSNSTLSIPIYQDLFIFMSTYFIKGPINLLEVMSCLNYCYNLYHIHYFNILFIIYYFVFFILLLTVL
jgi:NADH-ubiquinone oxidoreductase chain 5